MAFHTAFVLGHCCGRGESRGGTVREALNIMVSEPVSTEDFFFSPQILGKHFSTQKTSIL